MVTILAIIFGFLLIFAIVRVVQIKMGVTKRFGYHYTITMHHGLKLPDFIKMIILEEKLRLFRQQTTLARYNHRLMILS